MLGGPQVRLGQTLRLGDRMQDRVSRFTVEIGPLPRSIFNGFLPSHEETLRKTLSRAKPDSARSETEEEARVRSGGLLAQVRELIDAYLRDPLEYQVKVILEPEADEVPVLGSEHARMGMGVWLGEKPVGEIACRL